ncbi:MAG: 4-hydroxythreonine-4-phosphate dehydrogenase PdxA [Candidatus Omnitrophica bacterium]|jgi:4-hydroxythreonine-4-phosphate dehydrogenase|nr:4-hydroxythreonine-4-phosphate dehydrogenase PdxA [Candidatus Omnitrophota bacterium]
MPSYRSSKRAAPGRTRVVITTGDPFGIGPEVTLKSMASQGLLRLADFIVVGDLSVLSAVSRKLKIPLLAGANVRLVDAAAVDPRRVSIGRQSELSGKASLIYLDRALDMIEDGEADCIVNAPLSKEAVAASCRNFTGHTEYIAARFGVRKFAMMLAGGPLRVALVTRHIPVKDIPRAITKKDIVDCIMLSHGAMKGLFGIPKPRIGVASLNPHGGEGGKIGKEEISVIGPAVKAAKRSCPGVIGPISSEALFYSAYRGRLDCIIAMYHDQGLTPLKMIARDNSINVTLGLPFPRTSPGHGTAFDIAGKGIADAGPMIASIKLAVSMAGASRGRRR